MNSRVQIEHRLQRHGNHFARSPRRLLPHGISCDAMTDLFRRGEVLPEGSDEEIAFSAVSKHTEYIESSGGSRCALCVNGQAAK